MQFWHGCNHGSAQHASRSERVGSHLRTTNLLERLIEEVRRRERVIRIFSDERSPWRLLGALLAEEHELWITGRCWLAMDAYREWKKEPETEELERAA